MIDYQMCLRLNVPNSTWSISKDYESLIFHDDTIKPEHKQFEDWHADCEKYKAAVELVNEEMRKNLSDEHEKKVLAKMKDL